jgi:hypothetical protein
MNWAPVLVRGLAPIALASIRDEAAHLRVVA